MVMNCVMWVVVTACSSSCGMDWLFQGSEHHVTYQVAGNDRSARVGDEIGGHHVSGHVHTTAELSEVQQTQDNRRLSFRVPRQWMKYILPKGFIAVNGCSLTVRTLPEMHCLSPFRTPSCLVYHGRSDEQNLSLGAGDAIFSLLNDIK